MDGVRISMLKPHEIAAHDMLVQFAGVLDKLTKQEFNNVMKRWKMLHMIEGKEEQFFRNWLKRVSTPR